MKPLTFAHGGDYERQSLDQWIDEMMSEKHDNHGLTQLALMHCRDGSDPRPVCVYPVNGKKSTDLADLFERRARGIAQDLGGLGSGVHMFELWAFYGNKDRPTTFHPIVIRSKMPRDGNGSEGPAGHGPDAMRMRQTEAVFSQAYNKQAHLDATQATLITWLGNSLMNALAENGKLARDAIEALARERDKSHEHAMSQIAAIKSVALQDKLIGFAPALVNTAFGKEVFPQGVADTALLKTLVLGMAEKNPALLDMFTSAMKDDPVIGGAITARITEIIKEQNDESDRREAAIASIPKGPPPEDDAAGGTVVRLIDGKKGG
jgi:hypothetical protein